MTNSMKHLIVIIMGQMRSCLIIAGFLLIGAVACDRKDDSECDNDCEREQEGFWPQLFISIIRPIESPSDDPCEDVVISYLSERGVKTVVGDRKYGTETECLATDRYDDEIIPHLNVTDAIMVGHDQWIDVEVQYKKLVSDSFRVKLVPYNPCGRDIAYVEVLLSETEIPQFGEVKHVTPCNMLDI